MKIDSKGFTLVEVLVSVLISAIIILMGFSFFIYQSKGSGTAAKEMVSDEEVSLTLNLLKRDIIHAQGGINQNPELAVFVTDENNKADGAYHELYINYGRILSGHFSPAVNVFKSFAYLTQNAVAGSQFMIELPMIQTPTTPSLDAQAQGLQQDFLAHIGAAIIEPNPYAPGTIIVRDVNGATTGAAGSRACQFTFTGGGPGMAKYNFTPATVYRWGQVQVAPGEQYGVINRNGRLLLGGSRTLTVQDFRIRGLFVDTDGVTLRWTPDYKAFGLMPAANLRLIEATIRYRHLDLASETRREQTIEIGKGAWPGPRMTVLNAY